MSTNRLSTDRARARRFRRTLYGAIAVLSLAVLALVGLNLGQGPRLTAAQINLTTSVERTGQRLLLQANEPLEAVTADQLTITPAASATATVSGSSLEIQFSDTLRYNTTYTINVTGVKSISGTAASTLDYTFTTADPTVYFLVPAGTGTAPDHNVDRIVSAPLSGGNQVIVYTAPHIRRFVATPTALVVVTTTEDNQINTDSEVDAMDIVSLRGAADIPVQLTGTGIITSLKESAGSGLFGFTFSVNPSPLYPTVPDQLFAYDLTRGQDYTIPITGTDHEQLATTDWAFVPGTTSIVARTDDGAVSLIDTVGEREGTSGAQNIAHADELEGFLPLTKALIFTQNGGQQSLDLSKPNQAVAPYTGAVLPADSATCLSANGKYLAETVGDTITFRDLSSNTVLSTFTGAQPNWCN